MEAAVATMREVEDEVYEMDDQEDAVFEEEDPSQEEEEDLSAQILSAKDEGNQHYAARQWNEAARCYCAGLELCSIEEKDLEAALRSNLAQCLLKMEKYAEAQEQCNLVLTLDPANPKVWYRRALAREQLGFLKEALEDVQICLKHIDGSPVATDPMRRAAQQAFDRILDSFQHTNAKEETSSTETNGQPMTQQYSASTRPLPRRQRQVVAQLLRNNTTLDGEALFLLDWNWWTTWCQYVDFYSSQRYLSLLPPGAMLPKKQTNGDDSSSSDSIQEPQEIDNSNLFESGGYYFLVQGHCRLKPNLVRGHHYELIPREVYNALRSWYREVTPSICRRVVIRQEVAKLPLYVDPPTAPTLKNYCGNCRSPMGKYRCKQCLLVHYCSRSCQEINWNYHKGYCKQRKPSPLPSGLVGLNNLGNTCFMNSALQCLSHATPLTRHFLSNRFKQDLNTANPLGTKGKLANAYEKVMKDIWLSSQNSTSPTALKISIATFAPRFAGSNQHDAQEFLAYLLDGLHEDLNRVRQPPYVKMPDVVGSNLAVCAEEAWDAHRRRNDSLVFDTFYGQFKSTCVCPKCERVSVSFDAFNHVSLEIPQLHDMTRTLFILLFRVGEKPSLPMRYGVTVKRGSLVVDVREALSELCGIPSDRLVICDVYDHTIYEILKDGKPVSSVRASDVLTAYEVDPYTDTTIHAIAAHAIVNENSKSNTEATTELEASAEMSEEWLDAFGFPFLTSFPSQLTCREVWDQVWKVVKNVVAPKFFNGDDTDNSLKSLLRIRIVDNMGRSRPVFLDDFDLSAAVNGEGVDCASILPASSDEKLIKYLGKDCAGHFLFIRLEWLETTSNNTLPEEETKEEVAPVIDKERFLWFEDHPSFVEALQKIRATNVVTGVTLDQCFEAFSKPERLDEHNMWYCSKCKEHVRAMKTMELWRLPNILVVHLKRFEFKHILRRDKLDTPVDFPLDGLDMTKHCASARAADYAFVEDCVPAVYDLFAVTNHYGRMGFGHYTAFARSWDEMGMSNEWALFDDSSVRIIGDGTGQGGRNDSVVSSAAYVLFYRRRFN